MWLALTIIFLTVLWKLIPRSREVDPIKPPAVPCGARWVLTPAEPLHDARGSPHTPEAPRLGAQVRGTCKLTKASHETKALSAKQL